MRKALLFFLLGVAGIGLADTASAKDAKAYKFEDAQEVTPAADALDGLTLVATDPTAAYVMKNGGAQNMEKVAVKYFGFGDDLSKYGYRFEFHKATEAIIKDGVEVEGNLYAIRLLKEDDSAYAIWDSQGYVGDAGWVIYTLRNGKFNSTDDADFLQGIWKVDYSAENGYTIQNVNTNKYLSIADGNGSGEVKYIRLYKQISYDSLTITDFDFTATDAKTDIFDLAEAENYDQETGRFTAKGGWTYDTPQDFSGYKWLVVVTSQNASSVGGEFRITDENGKSIGGDEYEKGNGSSRGNMWLDRWNNQICATVNIEYLSWCGVDVTKIKSVTFSDNQPVGYVFLTNYSAGQAVSNTEGWGSFTGDYVREYAAGAIPNKFGTVVLPYAAAVSGAQIYSVQSFNESTGLVLSRHFGLMEAGVPYFYFANEEVGKDNGGNRNVNFVRASEPEVATPENGNGLTGVYADENPTSCYVLQNNTLRYVPAIATGVKVKANHCYFDPTKYSGPTPAPARVVIPTDGVTGINAINADALNGGKIFNINGQEVKSIEKGGVYIINGMKVFVK